MHTENIIKDIHDLIHDVKQMSSRVYSSRRDADRTSLKAGKEQEEHYDTVVEALVDASIALDGVNEDLLNLEEMLRTLISNIEMETLSHKVQSK